MSTSADLYKFSVTNEKKLESLLLMLPSKGTSRKNPLSRILKTGSTRDICLNQNGFRNECEDVYMMPATQYVHDDSAAKSPSCGTQESIGYCSTDAGENCHEDSSEISANLEELKEVLTLQDLALLNTLPPEIITSFVSANPLEVGSLIEKLGINNLPDDRLLALCQWLTALQNEPSLAWCTAFTTGCFLLRIHSLKRGANRDFINAITIWVNKFPRAVVEGFMVPCVLLHNIDDFQCKIVCEVFQGISIENQQLFLQKFFKERKQLNESLVALLQTMLDSKLKIDRALLDTFISLISNSAFTMANNLKFSKLIFSCIKTFGSEMSEKHLKDFNATIEQTNTSFKKACQTILKKHLEKK